MYCNDCGKRAVPGSVSCSYCGGTDLAKDNQNRSLGFRLSVLPGKYSSRSTMGTAHPRAMGKAVCADCGRETPKGETYCLWCSSANLIKDGRMPLCKPKPQPAAISAEVAVDAPAAETCENSSVAPAAATSNYTKVATSAADIAKAESIPAVLVRRYCESCGRRVPEGKDFCPKCGCSMLRDGRRDPYRLIQPRTVMIALTAAFIVALLLVWEYLLK